MEKDLLQFTKMHGLGNDFVVLDGMSQTVNLSPETITRLACRHTGIGFDQLLLIEEPPDSASDLELASSPDPTLTSVAEPAANFSYRIFNASGDEVGQCGNGARCVAKYLFERIVPARTSLTLKTLTTTLTAQRVPHGLIRVEMGTPNFEPVEIPLLADSRAAIYSLSNPQNKGETLQFSALSLGNPHAILCVDSLENFALPELGKLIGAMPIFPEGVNVGFMVVSSRQSIQLRVVERGVGETLACGSGACAAMVAAHQLGLVDDQVQVHLLGGELTVEWGGGEAPVWMTGPAVHVFDGAIKRDY